MALSRGFKLLYLQTNRTYLKDSFGCCHRRSVSGWNPEDRTVSLSTLQVEIFAWDAIQQTFKDSLDKHLNPCLNPRPENASLNASLTSALACALTQALNSTFQLNCTPASLLITAPATNATCTNGRAGTPASPASPYTVFGAIHI